MGEGWSPPGGGLPTGVIGQLFYNRGYIPPSNLTPQAQEDLQRQTQLNRDPRLPTGFTPVAGHVIPQTDTQGTAYVPYGNNQMPQQQMNYTPLGFVGERSNMVAPMSTESSNLDTRTSKVINVIEPAPNQSKLDYTFTKVTPPENKNENLGLVSSKSDVVFNTPGNPFSFMQVNQTAKSEFQNFTIEQSLSRAASGFFNAPAMIFQQATTNPLNFVYTSVAMLGLGGSLTGEGLGVRTSQTSIAKPLELTGFKIQTEFLGEPTKLKLETSEKILTQPKGSEFQTFFETTKAGQTNVVVEPLHTTGSNPPVLGGRYTLEGKYAGFGSRGETQFVAASTEVGKATIKAGGDNISLRVIAPDTLNLAKAQSRGLPQGAVSSGTLIEFEPLQAQARLKLTQSAGQGAYGAQPFVFGQSQLVEGGGLIVKPSVNPPATSMRVVDISGVELFGNQAKITGFAGELESATVSKQNVMTPIIKPTEGMKSDFLTPTKTVYSSQTMTIELERPLGIRQAIKLVKDLKPLDIYSKGEGTPALQLDLQKASSGKGGTTTQEASVFTQKVNFDTKGILKQLESLQVQEEVSATKTKQTPARSLAFSNAIAVGRMQQELKATQASELMQLPQRITANQFRMETLQPLKIETEQRQNQLFKLNTQQEFRMLQKEQLRQQSNEKLKTETLTQTKTQLETKTTLNLLTEELTENKDNPSGLPIIFTQGVLFKRERKQLPAQKGKPFKTSNMFRFGLLSATKLENKFGFTSKIKNPKQAQLKAFAKKSRTGEVNLPGVRVKGFRIF